MSGLTSSSQNRTALWCITCADLTAGAFSLLKPNFIIAVIAVQNLTVEFSAVPLFNNINYVINPRDRIALVGKNGAGKSTMLKIIAGLQRPTSGQVAVPAETTIGYLPQQMKLADETTLLEEVRKAFSHIDTMERHLDEINRQLAERTDYESEEYARLIEQSTTITDRLTIEHSENHEAEMERTLIGLGFVRDDFERATAEFSGGWRMRIELAKLLLQHPDVLLLDEPTNHLDMRSKDVLKDALKEFDGTVIVVSHDREFLDGLVDKVYEFGNKRVIEHLGGIYDFLEHKKMDSLCELERSTQTTTSMEGNAAEPTRNKLSYEARKEQSKAIKKVEKAIAESEKKITELENSIAAIEAKLATPEGAADVSLYTEYSELKKKLSDTMDLWTEQTLELEELNAANS